MAFNAEKLKKLNNLTMTTRDAQLGDFLVYVLENLSNTTASTSFDSSQIETAIAELTEIVTNLKENSSELVTIPTIAYVTDSDATTIKGLVSDYNDFLAALRASGLMASEE